MRIVVPDSVETLVCSVMERCSFIPDDSNKSPGGACWIGTYGVNKCFEKTKKIPLAYHPIRGYINFIT